MHLSDCLAYDLVRKDSVSSGKALISIACCLLLSYIYIVCTESNLGSLNSLNHFCFVYFVKMSCWECFGTSFWLDSLNKFILIKSAMEITFVTFQVFWTIHFNKIAMNLKSNLILINMWTMDCLHNLLKEIMKRKDFEANKN